MMNREEKRKIANKLAKLERKYQNTKDEKFLIEMEKVASSLTLEEMLDIDEYILEKYKNF